MTGPPNRSPSLNRAHRHRADDDRRVVVDKDGQDAVGGAAVGVAHRVRQIELCVRLQIVRVPMVPEGMDDADLELARRWIGHPDGEHVFLAVIGGERVRACVPGEVTSTPLTVSVTP